MSVRTVFLVLLLAVSIRTGICDDTALMQFADAPYVPYVYGEIGGTASRGIAVEIVHEVFRRIGVRVQVDLYPWRRVLKMAETGQSDGICLLMKTAEREDYLVFSDVVFIGEEVLLYDTTRYPDFTWEDFSDLTEYTIGLVDGYVYGRAFMDSIEALSLTVEYADDSPANLRKLTAGRVDLVVEERYAAAAMLKDLGADGEKIRAASAPVSEYSYYMALSRQSPASEAVAAVNEALAAMKADGTIDRILSRHR